MGSHHTTAQTGSATVPADRRFGRDPVRPAAIAARIAGSLVERRREQLVFVAATAALWSVFFVQAWQATTLLDDWYQLGWYKGHALDAGLVWRVARYNYFHANPRIGDVFLLLVDGPRGIHLALTPVVQIALLWASFVVAFGRRPRPSYRDLELLLVLQVMIWLASPIPGVIYFYRPFATNYLFAFATTLLVFAPYRLALARPPDRRARWWLSPAMFVLGWLAGMSNEHTGPAAIVAVGGCVVFAWRRRRLSAWMIAGALGLAAGYAMLMFAPGQAERYAGRAAKLDALGLIASRGVSGNFDILAGFLGEAAWAIDLVIAATLVFVHRHRHRCAGDPLPAMSRAQLLAIAGLVAAAGAIVVTLFASPVTIERLLFAPAVLLAAALAVIADYLFTSRRVRTLVTVACAIIFGYHAVRFVQVYAVARAVNRQRIAILGSSKPGTVAVVPAYRSTRSRWYWGDDFRMAAVREYVANELFELAGIDYDERPSWAEPGPPERFVASRVYEPPLAPELAAAHPLPRYIPSFTDTALGQLRRELALGGWRSIDGHRLVRYQVDATGSGFADPKRRPLRVFTWTPEGVTFVDGGGYEDADRQPAIRIWAPTMPARWTDAYLVGCGQTTPVEPRHGSESASDPLLPLDFACRGSYTAVVCDPDVCWFAGRFWR
jgi:Family of unknown function (DUF6056)